MISVVMSVYNTEKYLREAVDSILNQTYSNFEFIIVNDCSTDNSLKILEEYKQKNPKIILINNKVNIGLTKSLNLALKIAKGEYVARMDADDISNLNRFQLQMDFLEKNKHVDILGTFSQDINGKGKILRTRTTPIYHKEIISMLPKFSPISHPTVIFKRKKLESIGFYNPKYRTSQDLDMWLRAAGAGLIFHNLPVYLFKYRMDESFIERKTFNFRLNDFKLRMDGYKHISLPWYKYSYAVIPLILGLIPDAMYGVLKKIDPR